MLNVMKGTNLAGRVRVIAVLVILGPALAACGDGKPVEIDPNAPASAALEVHAKDLEFDARYLVAQAGVPVKLTLVNEDSGVLHNLAVYTDKSAKQVMYRGENIEGKKTVAGTLPPTAAGSYYFRCDVHPDMNGPFVVK
jgi:plastocyanin